MLTNFETLKMQHSVILLRKTIYNSSFVSYICSWDCIALIGVECGVRNIFACCSLVVNLFGVRFRLFKCDTMNFSSTVNIPYGQI